MNNRYIFRGKREDNSEWVTGDLMQWNDGDMSICLGTGVLFKVVPETVGQCTGLKDKNGKWIFESDVVNALLDFGMPIKAVCVFKDGSFGLLAKQHSVEHFHAFTSICNVKYEVIGNIYDNPELLEAER